MGVKGEGVRDTSTVVYVRVQVQDVVLRVTMRN